MTRPYLRDLFCGAGGAAWGYYLAGFQPVGYDIVPQPHYPFEFYQVDVFDLDLSLPRFPGAAPFAATHASPPCQDHSPLSALVGTHGTGWMLEETRRRLIAAGLPYVIENVASAKMPTSMLLCGSMFGLRTYRHRRFEIASHGMLAVPSHPKHRIQTSTKKRMTDWAAGMHVSVTGDIGSTIGGQALGIDWMTGNELSQAIPPAYTQFIGEQLLTHLQIVKQAV